MKNRFYQYFEEFASSYSKYRKRFRYYCKDIVDYNNFYINSEQSVLEIGCGTGVTLNKLNGKRKVGIDYSPAMIQVAKEQFPELEFHHMAAETLDLNETFDVVVLPNVVGYFDNVSDVFNALHKVCNEETRIIISYYNYLWEPVLRFTEIIGLKKKAPRQNWLSLHDLKNLLYHSGFEEFRSTNRVLIPINIPIISYLVNKFIAKLPFINHLCLNNYINARKVKVVKSEEELNKYSTTVLIPARNESGNIENAILRLPKFGKHIEILFVEGNSTDDT